MSRRQRIKRRYSALVKEPEIFKRGIWVNFSRNTAGTLIGIAMLWVTIFYASTAVGPFAGSTDLQNDMTVLYNNTLWVATLGTVLIFVVGPALMLFRDTELATRTFPARARTVLLERLSRRRENQVISDSTQIPRIRNPFQREYLPEGVSIQEFVEANPHKSVVVPKSGRSYIVDREQ